MNQFSSNRAFLQEKQESIQKQKALVFGESLCTESALFTLSGLGFEEILHFSSIPRPKTKSILQPFSRKDSWIHSVQQSMDMYMPHIQYQGVLSEPMTFLINECKPTVCIDTTHTKQTNERIADIAQKLSIPYVNTKVQQYKIRLDVQPNVFESSYSNHWMQILAGCLVADEARKKTVLFQDSEESISRMTTLNFTKDLKTKKNQYWQEKKHSHSVIVGAGGIGTYTALCEALKGTEQITIIDPDTIEIQNLNRQLLYGPFIGKPKAQTLASRLHIIHPKGRIDYQNTSFSQSTIPKNAQLFCCTDNYASRLEVAQYAEKQNIPLIEAGCSATSGILSSYVPHKTRTITEKRNLKAFAQREKEQTRRETSCAQNVNPSIITPNIVMGTLASLYANYRLDETQIVKELDQNLCFNSLLNTKIYSQ